MKTLTIAFFSSLLLASSATLYAQDDNKERPQRGNRERPDPFALADKDKSGGVTLEELVDSRVEAMSRGPRGGGGGEGAPARGEGNAERGGGQGGPRGGGDPVAMKKQLTERMGEAFKKADKDENGELSKEEFATMAPGQRGGGQRGPGGQGGGQRGNRGQ
jgi:hypothetical protein